MGTWNVFSLTEEKRLELLAEAFIYRLGIVRISLLLRPGALTPWIFPKDADSSAPVYSTLVLGSACGRRGGVTQKSPADGQGDWVDQSGGRILPS
ncbi:UNVERIFIED_CONTAM: hypothetical protein PYX00_006641 [Menopon gallinae]|uniref:Uncharacterized protein n=1 Tax=Menopon gallinae TaxID=328185 RepID=A0AAW2HWA3_9NEOP